MVTDNDLIEDNLMSASKEINRDSMVDVSDMQNVTESKTPQNGQVDSTTASYCKPLDDADAYVQKLKQN
jgi:type V secretory pathway adhesin AidA